MESIDFLKKKLQELSRILPYLEIRYEYRLDINTHIVEVKPIEYFNKDKEFIDYQIGLEDEFETRFPNEEILFITENELISVNDPILDIGIHEEICDYELLAPVKLEYSFEETEICFVETNVEIENKINTLYTPPPSRQKHWWNKLTRPNNETLAKSQGFLLNFIK